MSDNIPFDVQMEIIKKVSDVKSLIRFRSVSKQWMSFIDSPEFIACFGVRHTQPQSLLLRYKDNVDEVKYVSFVDGENQYQQDFGPNVPLFVKQLYNSKVIGSSYGLWCLHGFNSSGAEEMLVIWIPSIRISVGIVVPFVSSFCKMTNFGFGVCPSTYDPTIVMMSNSYGFLERKDTYKWQVEIFTLSSKTWKMIPSSNLPCGSFRFGVTTQVAIDKFIYWFSHDRIVGNDGASEIKNFILSFDLITHQFKEINLPSSLANELSQNFSISKLRESLVVSAYTNEVNHGRVYGVWMMEEEGGVMTSFKKLFNIKTPDDSPVSKVLGFTMSGEPIMETETDHKEVATVKVYKPCSEHIKDLGINGEDGSFFIFPYTETLLLVDHSDRCIISNDS
ncbi:putative F-box domain-containing protein [Tanacetum coccineum]|uniref:F-box domain-containing protein n=1 Tax=Tanacetum coccineum TaxID=301880 RepID=A0ABQ4XZH0_9ASTR